MKGEEIGAVFTTFNLLIVTIVEAVIGHFLLCKAFGLTVFLKALGEHR